MPPRWTRVVHWAGMRSCAFTSETLPAHHLMRETSACHRLTTQAIPCRSVQTKSSELISRPHPRFAGARPLPNPEYAEIYLQAMKRAGSLVGQKVRRAILKVNLNTVFGKFKVHKDGFQIAHKTLMFQWKDGKKVIVWPDELAPDKPRFPTPPWKERP